MKKHYQDEKGLDTSSLKSNNDLFELDLKVSKKLDSSAFPLSNEKPKSFEENLEADDIPPVRYSNVGLIPGSQLSCNFLQSLNNREPLLDSLIVTNFHLQNLPVDVELFQSLTRLDLKYNNLEAVTDEICEIITLERMYLSDNKLTCLPQNMNQLTNLISLHLSKNELREFPNLDGLVSLQELILYSNKITDIPSDILATLTGLKHLNMHSNPLTQFPSSIGSLTSLETLTISCPQGAVIPSSIGQLQSLRSIVIMESPSTQVPEEIYSLPNLRHASISGIDDETKQRLEAHIRKLHGLPEISALSRNARSPGTNGGEGGEHDEVIGTQDIYDGIYPPAITTTITATLDTAESASNNAGDSSDNQQIQASYSQKPKPFK